MPHDAQDEAVASRVLWVAGLAAFACALSIRLLGIDSRDLWLDEIYTQFAASRDWLGLVQDRVSRGHSPFYFAVLKSLGVDIANPAAIRTVSAVFDAGAAGVLTAGTLRYFGARAALLVGAFYVLSPLHIHWAQNARPYGLLMLFTAIGLMGAVGLMHRISTTTNGEDASRVPHLMFAVGWSGACLTLTGGIVTYLVVLSVPWWPGLRKGLLSAPDFRRQWIRAQRWPTGIAVLTYLLVSRVHVFDRIGNYWLESRRPFGLDSLTLLAEELATGEVRQASSALAPLPPHLALDAALVFVASVIAGALLLTRRAKTHPETLPILALGFGVAAVMMLMSLSTSLLTGRYFSPPWMGLLVAAGIGISSLRPRIALAVAVPQLTLMCVLAFTAATAVGQRRAPDPRDLAALIDASDYRHAPIVSDRSVFRELRMELMLLRLDEPGLGRPEMKGSRSGEEARRYADLGEPFFIVVSTAEWEEAYSSDHSAGACSAKVGDWLIARIGAGTCTAGDLSAVKDRSSEL